MRAFHVLTVLSVVALTVADQPGYGAPPAQPPPVKYGGPIVYTGEKPPIIHFPPPPEKVKTTFCRMTFHKIRFDQMTYRQMTSCQTTSRQATSCQTTSRQMDFGQM